MRPLFAAAVLFAATSLSLVVAAEPRDDVAAATQAWVAAFNSHDPERIVSLYADDAVFWGTGSQILRDTPALVRAYFSGMPNNPDLHVAISEQRVRVFGDIAINTGAYTFSNLVEGTPTSTPARFSFTYQLRAGRWMIVDHHSSVVPPAK